MNRTLRIVLLLLCLLCLDGKILAQTITLSEARERAHEHNKQMGIANETLLKAQNTLRAMKSNYFPKLSGSAYAYYTTDRKNDFELGSLNTTSILEGIEIPPEMLPQLAPLLSIIPAEIPLPSIPMNLNLSNSYLASISLEQPIYMGGKIIHGNKMAKIGVEMAELNEKLSREQVIISVDEAYWTLVQTIELKATAEAYMRAIDEVYRVVNNAMEAGMRTEVDLMRVKVEQSNARLQLQRAENGIKLAQMNLCQVIGAPLTDPIFPEEDFPEALLLAENVGDPTARPEYSLLSKQIDLKAAEVKVVRSDFLPHLGLRAAYTYTHGIRLNDQLLLDNFSPSVMLSLSVPIFRWGEGRSKVRAAQSEQRIAALKREEVSEKIILEQQQALNHYNELLMEVELTQSTVEETKELLKRSHDRYRAGFDTTANLLEAETMAVKANSERINAKAKLALARTTLLKALGKL